MPRMRKLMIVLLSLGIVSCNTNAGWIYTAVTRAEDGEQAQGANSSVKGWTDGRNARVEIEYSANPMLPPQSYLISTDGGQTLYLVNPGDRTYSRWDINAMMGLAGGAMQMLGMSFTTPKVEKLVDEPGPQLLGFPTRHYRFVTTYAMNMNFLGMKRTTEFFQEEDIWATDQLKDEGFNAWLNQRPTKTGNTELDKLIDAETTKIRGFPLKRISITTEKGSDGTTQTVKMVMEVTALSKTNTPPGFYELPEGYTEKPLIPSFEADSLDKETSEDPDPSGEPKNNPFLNLLQQMQKRK